MWKRKVSSFLAVNIKRISSQLQNGSTFKDCLKWRMEDFISPLCFKVELHYLTLNLMIFLLPLKLVEIDTISWNTINAGIVRKCHMASCFLPQQFRKKIIKFFLDIWACSLQRKPTQEKKKNRIDLPFKKCCFLLKF